MKIAQLLACVAATMLAAGSLAMSAPKPTYPLPPAETRTAPQTARHGLGTVGTLTYSTPTPKRASATRSATWTCLPARELVQGSGTVVACEAK